MRKTQDEKTSERLKDRQAQRETYINKINETQIKLARVEEEIKELRNTK